MTVCLLCSSGDESVDDSMAYDVSMDDDDDDCDDAAVGNDDVMTTDDDVDQRREGVAGGHVSLPTGHVALGATSDQSSASRHQHAPSLPAASSSGCSTTSSSSSPDISTPPAGCEATLR